MSSTLQPYTPYTPTKITGFHGNSNNKQTENLQQQKFVFPPYSPRCIRQLVTNSDGHIVAVILQKENEKKTYNAELESCVFDVDEAINQIKDLVEPNNIEIIEQKYQSKLECKKKNLSQDITMLISAKSSSDMLIHFNNSASTAGKETIIINIYSLTLTTTIDSAIKEITPQDSSANLVDTTAPVHNEPKPIKKSSKLFDILIRFFVLMMVLINILLTLTKVKFWERTSS